MIIVGRLVLRPRQKCARVANATIGPLSKKKNMFENSDIQIRKLKNRSDLIADRDSYVYETLEGVFKLLEETFGIGKKE